MKPVSHPRDGLIVKLYAIHIGLDSVNMTSDLDDSLFVL